MWILFTLAHTLCLAGVNYIDEYLTHHNSVTASKGIHERVGGLVLISTLFNFIGAALILIFFPVDTIGSKSLIIVMLSAVAMVGIFLPYFYLLNTYSAHQVVPLFQLAIIWTLVFDFLVGTPFTQEGLVGVGILSLGAYLVDAGSFYIKIPSRLFLMMIITSLFVAAASSLMKIASFSIASSTLAFYQFLTIAAIGLLLLTLIKSYRLGFYDRIKNQGKLFVGFSIINELLAQGGYFFGIVAIAMVPVLSYYSSMGGFQGVFLLLLFLLFPLHERNRVTLAQGIGVILIGIGVYVVYTYG